MRLLSLITLLITSLFTFGQGIEQTPVINFASTTYHMMATGDIDNNGIIDLLTADEQFIWFEGNGTATPGADHIIQADLPEYVNQCYLQDLNGDDLLDIYYLLGSSPFVVGILFNPGPGGTEWEQYAIPGYYYHVVGFFDVDGDVDVDFVYEDSYSYLGYRTNDANTFNTANTIPDAYSYTGGSFKDDIDKDGDIDWVAEFTDCCIHYFSNNSNGTFTVDHVSSGEYIGSMYCIDLDGDTYSEIAFLESGVLKAAYFQPATNTFGSATLVTYLNPYFESCDFVDLDNDGDKDGMFRYQDTDPDTSYYIYKWLENPGPGIPFVINELYLEVLIPETPYSVNCRAIGDITNDNKPDIIINATTFEGDYILIYENDNPVFQLADTTELPYVPTASEVICFDMDADPDNDLVIAFDNGLLAWYEYDHLVDSFTTLHTILEMPNSPIIKNIKKKDLDNDGDFDLISSFAGIGGSFTYYSLNDGAGGFTNYLLDNVAMLNIWLMDADEDGDLDFTAMMPSFTAYLAYYENTGDIDSMFAYVDDISSMADWKSFVDIDIDQDGDIDMVGAREYSSQVKAFINEDGAGAYTSQENYFSAECANIRSLYASDFDDDGDEDIVYTCENGFTYFSSNEGDTHTQNYIGTFDPTTLVNGSHTTMYDLNMDGFEDLIYNKTTGGSGYKLATGLGTFQEGYDAFSVDYGRFSNVDAGIIPDFIGIDESKLYVQYNILMLAPSFDISGPTASYLEEGGAPDTLQLVFHSIPQDELSIQVMPYGTVDAGAGEGIAYSILIPSDSTALDTINIICSVPDDAIIEDLAAGGIMLSGTPETWGMYTDLIEINHSYNILDNDLGLFYSPGSATFTEGTSSDTIYAHINIALEAPATISLSPSDYYNAGFGAGVNPSIIIPSGVDATTPFTLTANCSDNLIYSDTIHTTLTLNFNSLDAQIDGFTPEPIEVIILENDIAEIVTTFPAATITEGIESFNLTFSLTSAPQADVEIAITPDIQIDLGAGAGNPVFINFYADGTIPEPIIVTGFAFDDYIVEYTHTSLIHFSVISDDEYYSDDPIEDLTITINDNDAPQGISVISPPLTTYLEGTMDIPMSFALWTNPYEPVLIHATPEISIDLGLGAGIPVTITFDPVDDATEPQILLIDLVNDMEITGATTLGTIHFTIETLDPVLAGATISDIALNIQDEDIDQAYIISSPTDAVMEGDPAVTYAIALNQIPNAPVTITATPDEQLNLGAGAGVPVEIYLNGATALEEHIIEIEVEDDYLVEGAHTGNISFSVTTEDIVIAELTLAPLTIEIIDNDELQSVITDWDATTHMEGSADLPINLSLQSIPNQIVLLHLFPDESLDLGNGIGVSVTLIFYPDATALESQLLLLQVADNFVYDGFRTEYILMEAETLDPAFEFVTLTPLAVNIEDNDSPQGITIDETAMPFVAEGGTPQELIFDIWTQPHFLVTINAVPNDQIDLGDGPGIPVSLYFYPDETSDLPQTIIVSAVDDTIVEGDHAGLISYTITTDDPQFIGYSLPITNVSISDNDVETDITAITDNTFTIYPTIVTEMCTIHFSSGTHIQKCHVLNSIGQVVMEVPVENNGTTNLDLSSLQSGQYWISVVSNDGIMAKPLILAR